MGFSILISERNTQNRSIWRQNSFTRARAQHNLCQVSQVKSLNDLLTDMVFISLLVNDLSFIRISMSWIP